MSRLLLDTHVGLWLMAQERRRVPEGVHRALADPGSEVLLSVVCVWEAALKRSLDKIGLEDTWRQDLLDLRFTRLVVTFEHAAAVEHLPHHHRDPFDRMLVAQAQVEDAVLVTADRRLDAYDIETLWGDAP